MELRYVVRLPTWVGKTGPREVAQQTVAVLSRTGGWNMEACVTSLGSARSYGSGAAASRMQARHDRNAVAVEITRCIVSCHYIVSRGLSAWSSPWQSSPSCVQTGPARTEGHSRPSGRPTGSGMNIVNGNEVSIRRNVHSFVLLVDKVQLRSNSHFYSLTYCTSAFFCCTEAA